MRRRNLIVLLGGAAVAYEIGPAGTTFVKGTALGAEYDGTLWMGSARANSQVGGNGGSLYRFELTSNRLRYILVTARRHFAEISNPITNM